MAIIQLEEHRVLKALIVDGNATSRSTLEHLLSKHDRVVVEQRAASARAAIEALGASVIDVVFIDVNLPDASGLTLVRALQNLQSPPAAVLMSSERTHALDAFDAHAVDFLVKPVLPDRLQETIALVREHAWMRALSKKLDRFVVEQGGKKCFIPVDGIRFAEAHDDHAYVQTAVNRYFISSNLKRLEENLRKYGFFRVHRSFLVNLDQVEEIQTDAGGRLTLTMSGIGEKIPVSRRRASKLKCALGI